MLSSYFVFNGVNSFTMDLIIKQNRVRKIPKRNLTIFSVPGKNGDIFDMTDTWENVQISYTVKINNGRSQTVSGTLSQKVQTIAAWLHSAGANAILRDSFRSGGFRLATFVGPADIASKLEKYGEGTITFNCDPRFFLDSGDEWINCGTSRALTNPTAFPAKPLIRITSTGNVWPSLLNPNNRTRTDALNPTNTRSYYIYKKQGVSNCLSFSVADTTGYSAIPIEVLPSKNYAFSVTKSNSNSFMEVRQYNYAGELIANIQTFTGTSGTFRTSDKAAYITFYLYPNVASTGVTFSNFQLQIGTSAPTYLSPATTREAELELFSIDAGLNDEILIRPCVGTVYIDTETFQAYDPSNTSLNKYVFFPTRKEMCLAGNMTTSISADSYVSKIEVKPRWWTL